MEILKCKEIVKAVDGKLLSGSLEAEFSNITTDSRVVKNGDFFIPLVGEKFDGHDYILSSFEKGAAGCLTHRDMSGVDGKIVIKVEDTLAALRKLAAYYRQKFDIPFVGITGSVGKTSTKDMVYSVLSQKYNVLRTQGNFNNEIGVPLTVFNLESYHEAAVVEMGMSGLGEISRLTSIVRPDIAIITNIGLSHIEKLGSRQNILRAKMEILEGLKDNGLVILNGDDNLLSGLKGLLKHRTVFYGMEDGLDYQAYNISSQGEMGTSFEITIGYKDYKVHVPAPGIHNIHNALAAIAVGVELNIPVEDIIKGIGEFLPGKMRLNIIDLNGIKIINDAYNASPQSMEVAINVLKDVANSNNRTIAVLGDMLELGDISVKAHRDIGKYAAMKEVSYIFTVGKKSKDILEGAIEAGMEKDRVLHFEDNAEAGKFLIDFVKPGDVLVVKGSRGMKMEEIVNLLTTEL
ncbi:UDP-N-acetylmuramoyl-tripeptide--D-alanyl-D-alanine ligase [Acetivibrio clariflavus]|uniref:UDP-N-acetylmuramoyl-tripeptide--D-alanyl-D- alanine ligase n=1 Tax=Acetivibrio clariflavus TaxID=288965 RepID=UPI0031F591CB